MYLDANLKFQTLTVNNAAASAVIATSTIATVGADNAGDGVMLPELYVVVNTVPGSATIDATTLYAVDLAFCSDVAGTTVVSTVPIAKGVSGQGLVAGKYVTNPRPILRFPAEYAKVTITPSGTSASNTGAKFDCGFSANCYKPDANV